MTEKIELTTRKMTMGDHGRQTQYLQRSNQPAGSLNSPNKYPYNHVTRGANKMLASYSLPGHMMQHRPMSNNNNNNVVMYNPQQQQMMQPPQGYTVIGASLEDHCSLPSSDIGEVDLDLWDLDINAPSVSPNSAGHLSPAVPPGRRSSDTSSTSGCRAVESRELRFSRAPRSQQPWLAVVVVVRWRQVG